MKGSRPSEARLFDSETFKEKARSNLVVAVRKELITSVVKDDSSTDASPRLNFVLSTAAVDRSNDTIDQDGWDTSNFVKNPVMLWAHDSSQAPVGRAPNVLVETDPATKVKRLVARAVEFQPRELSQEGWACGQMYQKGFLNAVSVGFMPKMYAFNDERGGYAVDFQAQELLEFSAVPVPANPEALQLAKSAGIPLEWLEEWAVKILDGAKPTADGWSPPSRRFVERMHAVMAPKQVQVPAPKTKDADAAADEALLETLAGVEAALTANTAQNKATGDAVQALGKAIEALGAILSAEPKSVIAPATKSAPEPVVPPPPSAEEVAEAVGREAAKQIAELTGRFTR